MSAPSPGTNVQGHDSPSEELEAGAKSESAPSPLEHEPQNISSNDLSGVETQLPPPLLVSNIAESIQTERQHLQEKLQIWSISDERLTKSPGDSKQIEKRKTYTSFGDNGTTASVSAYGRLLQICQYFGVGRSGFFCADLPAIDKAWYSNYRLETLLEKAESMGPTIGINWKEAFNEAWDFDDILPCLDFVEDRWPRFTRPTSDQRTRKGRGQTQKVDAKGSVGPHRNLRMSTDWSFSVQYFCHDGMVFQRDTLERKSDTVESLLPSQLELEMDLLIRNLDFSHSIGFNDNWKNYEHDFKLGAEEKSLVVIHPITPDSSLEMGMGETGTQKDAVLTITPYINGELQSLILRDRGATIELSTELQAQIKKLGVLDVVLTYKLQFDERTDSKPASFEEMINLDFIIRRNVEHILSVCSIPVPWPKPVSTEGEQVASTNDVDSPIALTCGDISGHRVGLEASFYALQFLRDVQQHLQDNDSSYARILMRRIRKTCERHSKWVLYLTDAPEEDAAPENQNTAERPSRKPSAFSTHYWASGKAITNTSYLAGPSLVDTPLQILKISENEVLAGEAKKRLAERIAAWLRDLDEKDEMKRYAFARSTSSEKEKFHLVDHIRISQTVSKISRMRFDDDQVGDIMNRFKSDFVRKSILKRFITEHPISKQRMLATSRTPSETRFLFHSKDTALFHAMDFGVFSTKRPDDDDKYDSWKYLMDEWTATIECQVDHEETQQLTWKKPLWYALAFILASNKRQINRMPPEILFENIKRKLLDLYSPSGLFPGLLTKGQVPVAFENEAYRDNYWQTTFEIPYILWKYGKEPLETVKATQLEKERKSGGINSAKTRGYITKKLPFANSNKLIDSKGLVEISDDWLQQGPAALEFGSKPKFLGHLGCDESNPEPFITKVGDFPSDLEKVASVAWESYHSGDGKFPDSFTDQEGEKGLVIDIPRSYVESDRGGLLKTPLVTNQALADHLGKRRDIQSAKKRLVWLPQADKETALVCCLASPPDERYDLSTFFDRHAAYDKYFSDETSVTLNEWKTEFHLSFYRLAESTSLTNFCGGKGIPDFSYVIPQPRNLQEKPKYGEGTPATGIVRAALGFRFVGDFFDRNWTCHFLEYIPGNPVSRDNVSENSKQRPRGRENGVSPHIRKAPETSSGEASPTAAGETTVDGSPGRPETLEGRMRSLQYIPSELEGSHPGKRKYPWQQRKVLELLLFDQILLDLERETRGIFDWARDSVLKPSRREEGAKSIYSGAKPQISVLNLGSGSNGQSYSMTASDPLNPLSEAIVGGYQFVELGDSEGYFNLIGRWRLFEEILQTLGEDLNENLERINEWCSREKDREPESPRWTRNDERLFRHTIKKLRVQNQRRIRGLERLYASIQTFRGSLSGRLDSIREDMSFRGSENMSLFTYVTVIFLPLGFATGIFSMSEAPGRLTLAFMIATAVISLSITVLALVNAKSLLGLAKRHGKPVMAFVLFVLYSCLFVVYAAGAVLRPLSRPIYNHVIKPALTFLGTEEHLERYKKKLNPIREFDLANKVSEWVEREKGHDRQRQQGSHGMV